MSDRYQHEVEPPARTRSGPKAGSGASAWSRYLALATLVAAVPLIFFGGTVTTLHAGLAIDGWLVLEPGKGDWFLWAYPLEQWFRDVGTFVEHTHRLLGSAVGLLAIATVIATFVADRRAAAFKLSTSALVCVIVQGVLGGMRVLEKSEDLAFLHGAFGQLTFALLCAGVVTTRPNWIAASSLAADQGTRLRTLAILTVCAVYSEIVAGAWLRHGGATPALFLHVVWVVAVVLCVMLLVRELARSASELARSTSEANPPRTFQVLRWSLILALGGQIALGLFAFLSIYVIVGRNPGSVPQSLFPTLHVMGGAALLSTSVTAFLWSWKRPRTVVTTRLAQAGPSMVTRAELGGTR